MKYPSPNFHYNIPAAISKNDDFKMKNDSVAQTMNEK